MVDKLRRWNVPSDYDFWKLEKCILRVVGPYVEGESYSCLVRYVRSQGLWQKPPKYATENGDQQTLSFAPRQVLISDLEQCLAAASPDEAERRINPFDWRDLDLISSQTKTLLSTLSDDASDARSARVGVIGSRLVGLDSEGSDVDLLIRQNDSRTRAELQAKCEQFTWPELEKLSSKASNFSCVFQGPTASLHSRNLSVMRFRGLVVDIHVQRLGEPSNAAQVWESSEWRHVALRLADVSDRFLYPARLLAEGMTGQQVDIVSLNPSLQFVMQGDVVEAVGLWKSRGGREHFILRDLISVT